MTTEEKIAELINIRDKFNYSLAPNEVFDGAIKALRQQDVIDKVRAEIETQEKWLSQAGYNRYNVDIAFSSIKLALTKSEVEK